MCGSRQANERPCPRLPPYYFALSEDQARSSLVDVESSLLPCPDAWHHMSGSCPTLSHLRSASPQSSSWVSVASQYSLGKPHSCKEYRHAATSREGGGIFAGVNKMRQRSGMDGAISAATNQGNTSLFLLSQTMQYQNQPQVLPETVSWVS